LSKEGKKKLGTPPFSGFNLELKFIHFDTAGAFDRKAREERPQRAQRKNR
jgi:hypothetical protein